jgi:hypothetical protein
MLPLNKGARYVFHPWVHVVGWIREHGPVPSWWNFVTERWAGVLKAGLHSMKSPELGIMQNYVRMFLSAVDNFTDKDAISDRDVPVVVSPASKTTVDLASPVLVYATPESKSRGDDDIATQLQSFRIRQAVDDDIVASGVNNTATFHVRGKTRGILRRVWDTDQKYKSRSSVFVVGEGDNADEPLYCRLERIVRWQPYLSAQSPVWYLYVASYYSVFSNAADNTLPFPMLRLRHDHLYHKCDRVDHMHTMFNSNVVLMKTTRNGPGDKWYALTVLRNEKVDQARR